MDSMVFFLDLIVSVLAIGYPANYGQSTLWCALRAIVMKTANISRIRRALARESDVVSCTGTSVLLA